MVTKAWLLGSCLLLGCTREYDDVTPALAKDGYVQEGNYIYNLNLFHGNATEGEPFVALCPGDQALVGISVGLSKERLNGVSLRCADFDLDGNLGDPSYGKRFGAEVDPANEEKALECGKGLVATALIGSEEVYLEGFSGAPPIITRLGIECTQASAWMDGGAIAERSLSAGVGRWGTVPFADSCIAGVFVLNGFYGRFSDRLEQISLSCITPDDTVWRYLGL